MGVSVGVWVFGSVGLWVCGCEGVGAGVGLGVCVYVGNSGFGSGRTRTSETDHVKSEQQELSEITRGNLRERSSPNEGTRAPPRRLTWEMERCERTGLEEVPSAAQPHVVDRRSSHSSDGVRQASWKDVSRCVCSTRTTLRGHWCKRR